MKSIFVMALISGFAVSSCRPSEEEENGKLAAVDGPEAALEGAAAGSRAIECPTGRKPSGGWPLVFTVNGNALGPVKADGMAADLAKTLKQRGVCSMAIAHPSLRSQAVFESNIIGAVRSNVRRLSAAGYVNKNRVGIAGYSGGGAVATIIASRYPSAADFNIKGVVNFYGPTDMNAYFDFHGPRGQGAELTDPLFTGEKGPKDICNTARGPEVCQKFSASALKVVAGNVGSSTANRDFLSVRKSTTKPAPIFACFGTKDDNVTILTNQRIIAAVWNGFGVEQVFKTYPGGHGATWSSCPEALDWLTKKLSE